MNMIASNSSQFNPQSICDGLCNLESSRLPKAECDTIIDMDTEKNHSLVTAKKVHEILHKLRFHSLYDSSGVIKARVDAKSYNSFLCGKPIEPCFNQQTSKFRSGKDVQIKTFNGDIISIDIGGTHTKVAILKEGQELKDAKFILDKANDFFTDESYPLADGSKENDINKFIGRVVEQISIKLKKLYGEDAGVLDNIKGLSVIWSNAVKSEEIKSDTISGVTGIVTGVKEFYQKGEWFTKNLEDGVDLGKIFIDKSLKYGMKNLTTFCIGNDTVLTQLALDNADAGVVNSTGGNATGVGRDGEIYNLESGAGITVKMSELSDIDLAFLKEYGYITDENQDFECPIQYLASGNWLDKMLNTCIVAISNELDKEFEDENNPLKKLADKIKESNEKNINNNQLKTPYIDNKKISALLRCEDPFNGEYGAETMEYLTHICKEVVNRAAYAASFILYSSIAHRITGNNYDKGSDDKLVIALDSSLARNIEEYKTAFVDNYFLEDLVKNKNIEVVLLKPINTDEGDEISVPLQGAFNAIKRCQA